MPHVTAHCSSLRDVGVAIPGPAGVHRDAANLPAPQEPLAKAGIPPLVLTAPLLLASAPFWITYMNFWMAMGDSITQKQGFSRIQLFNIANIYAVTAILSCIAGVFYWRMIGLL